MSRLRCHCHDVCIWVMRRGSVRLSNIVNISHFLLLQALITSHLFLQALAHQSLFFSLSPLLYPSLSLYFAIQLLLPLISCSESISSLVSVPWPRCITRHKHLRAPDPLATRSLPSIDVLFSVNLSESFSAPQLTGMRCRSWQPTVIAACLAACRSFDRTATCIRLSSDGDMMSPVQSSACPCVETRTPCASTGTHSCC